ncbi:hypothetical protein [Streptomyces sp. JNUCC 63]
MNAGAFCKSPGNRRGRDGGAGGAMLRAFVEVDQATTGPERLAAKVSAYARLYHYTPVPVARRRLAGQEEWRRRYVPGGTINRRRPPGRAAAAAGRQGVAAALSGSPRPETGCPPAGDEAGEQPRTDHGRGPVTGLSRGPHG